MTRLEKLGISTSAVGFILLILLLIYSINTIQGLKSQLQQKESVIAEKNAIIEYRTNELGQVVASKDAAVLRANDLEKAYPEIYKSLEKTFDIKVRDLKVYMENSFAAYGRGTGTVTNHYHYDSSANKNVFDSSAFAMNDNYLKFNVSYYPEKSSWSPYTYIYSDTAKTAFASTKKWWQVFKNEKIVASTVFSNPQAKIISTTNILVDNYRDKRFSVSISIGYGIVKTKNEVNTGWFVGPTISYSLAKF